jgi:hypothetical protein
MPEIHVDPDKLEHKVRELQSVKDGIHSWRKGTSITGMFAAVGHGDLENQLHHFHHGWHDGMDEIEKSLDGAPATLRAAIETYRTADQKLGETASKLETAVQQMHLAG